MSQLLVRIEAQLTSTLDSGERALLIAQRACYWARVGRFEEARSAVSDLRVSFGHGQDGRVTIWIMLLEGLIQHFQSLGAGAKDRFNRAQFLSLTARDPGLIAITSAWKAHVEFETSDYSAMVASLKLFLDNATAQNHDACCRAAMVLADTLYFCGERQIAQKWFMLSRDHALAAGDQATIDALLYNRAAFGLAWLRAQRCFGQVDQELVAAIGMEISSSKNFQVLVNVQSLQNHLYLCESRALSLAENFEDACAALERVRGMGPFSTYNFSQAVVDMELAYYNFRMGKIELAALHFEGTRGVTFDHLHVDEQLVMQWMRFELAQGESRFGDPAQELFSLVELRNAYRESISALSASVASIAVIPESIQLHGSS